MAAQFAENKFTADDEWIEVDRSDADENINLNLAAAGDVSGEWDQVLLNARVATYASVLSHNLEGTTPAAPRPVGLIKRPKRQVAKLARL